MKKSAETLYAATAEYPLLREFTPTLQERMFLLKIYGPFVSARSHFPLENVLDKLFLHRRARCLANGQAKKRILSAS